MNVYKLVGLVVLVALGLGAVPSQASKLEAGASMAACPPGTTTVTVLAEDFEGDWLPAGWSIVDQYPSPDCSWRQESGWNYTGGAGAFAVGGGEGCLGEQVDTALVSVEFDLSGLQYAWLQFRYDYSLPFGVSGSVAEVDLFDSGGSHEVLVHWEDNQPGPATLAVDIPVAYYQADVGLAFHHAHLQAPLSADAWWQVDDVQVFGCVELHHTYLPFVQRNAP